MTERLPGTKTCIFRGVPRISLTVSKIWQSLYSASGNALVN